MTKYYAEWSGSYPCLCSGEWTLFIDDEPCKVEIPFQGDCADTFGTYEEWHFENWIEVFEDYECGMHCDDWCNEYQDYLEKVAPKSDWPLVFEAFQANDWRHGSCGGCI
jgi:hypothetical protein